MKFIKTEFHHTFANIVESVSLPLTYIMQQEICIIVKGTDKYEPV